MRLGQHVRVAGTDRATVVVDIAADSAVARNGSLLDVKRAAGRHEVVSNGYFTCTGLGQRVAVEVESIVKSQCRAAGNVGRRVGKDTERYLELVRAPARSDVHGRSHSGGRALHVHAGAATDSVTATYRVVEGDAVDRDVKVGKYRARFSADRVPESGGMLRPVRGTWTFRRRLRPFPPTGSQLPPEFQLPEVAKPQAKSVAGSPGSCRRSGRHGKIVSGELGGIGGCAG